MIELTNDQNEVVNGIVEVVNKSFNPKKFILGLTGFPGVGKTVVCNWIVNNSKWSISSIRCCAPTHKACRVLSEALGGVECFTIQSTFGLRLNMELSDFDPKNPQFEPKAKPKLDNIKLLLIDEASMIPSNLITFIMQQCKEKEIYVLFVGDSNQLPPVNEKTAMAFKVCSILFRLNKIIRQANNNPIAQICKLLRDDIDNKTFKFIEYVSHYVGTTNYDENGEGFAICPIMEFKDAIDRSFSIEEYKKNIDMYRIIAYTNVRVNSWNRYIRHTVVPDAEKAILTKNDLIMSNETIVNEFLEVIINNSEEYIVYDIANYVDEKYGLKGFLVKFQMVHGGKITHPLFVIDHKDQATINAYIKIMNELINSARSASGTSRIAKWKKYFDFKKRYILATSIFKDSYQTKPMFVRDIDYGYAITSHRAQGSTYDTVFVDMNDMVYTKSGTIYGDSNEMLRRLYVACSRARKELYICFGA